MMRWISGAFGVVLAACLVTGCNRQCFLSKEVYDGAHSSLLPPSLELDYTLGTTPLTGPTDAPATVNTPDRPPRYLSLQEAIAIALESGTASLRTGAGTGTFDQNLVTSPPTSGNNTANLTSQTDNIRVLSLNPAIAGSDIEAAQSRFDATWITSMNWTTTDNLLQGLNSFNNGESAVFSSSIVKALASGGFISTTFQQNYQLLTAPPTGAFNILNPLYTSQLTIGFEQPLFRNYGVRINELLSGTPSPLTGIGIPNQVAGQYSSRQLGALQAGGVFASDGILIARLRFDQNRADFERIVQGLVLQVESAYWNLYNAYGSLYSFEESLRIAHRAWMIAHAQLQAGKINAADYAPVRGQYEDFRTQRTQALGQVLDSERQLRGILGLPVEDGCRIVPVTPPSMAHFEPDWLASLHDALNLRPELIVARDNLRLAQYNLEVTQNYLKPDVRFAAQYTPLGFGTTLQGGGTFLDATGAQQSSNALRSLADNRFTNYTIGLNMFVPLGFRLEHASMRTAKLALAQNYYLVKDQENKATQALTQQFQALQLQYKLIETTRAARKAYAEAVDVRFKKIIAGAGLADISFLDFQSKLATAQVAEYRAIAEYNKSLANFEWTKGTILKYNNVHIAEGQLPQCAQVRAVEHEKDRSRALVIAERPDPLTHPGRLANTGDVPPSDAPLPLPFLNQPPRVLDSGNVSTKDDAGGKLEVLPPPQVKVLPPIDKPAETTPTPPAPPTPPAKVSGADQPPTVIPPLSTLEPAFKASPAASSTPFQVPAPTSTVSVPPTSSQLPALPALPATKDGSPFEVIASPPAERGAITPASGTPMTPIPALVPGLPAPASPYAVPAGSPR